MVFLDLYCAGPHKSFMCRVNDTIYDQRCHRLPLPRYGIVCLATWIAVLFFSTHSHSAPAASPASATQQPAPDRLNLNFTPTETADLNSTLARHAARTTTVTEPFQYKLKNPAGLTLLYNGCRSSKIEPCGCRALNLGGIGKEAAMVQTIRRENPQTLFVDAGGYFNEFADRSMRLQTWFMLKALASLDCQVMNVGFPDLQQGMGALQYFKKEFNLPFISANIVDSASGKPVFDAYKSFEMTLANGVPMRVTVVGVTATSRDVSRGPMPGRQDNREADKTSQAPADSAFPAGRWMIAETNGIVPWLPFDVHSMHSTPKVITAAHNQGGAAPSPTGGGKLPLPVEFAVNGSAALTSGTLQPYRVKDLLSPAQELGRELRDKNDLLILVAYTSFKHAAQMADDLREYDLIIAADYIDRMEPIRPVADGPLVVCGDHEGKYLGIVEIPVPSKTKRLQIEESSADMLPILQTIEGLPQFQKFRDKFAALTEKLPIEEPANRLADKIYAGVTSCRACHIDEYNQWKTHKHSHAMKTLVDRNMQYNPDCLQCHTVAYRQPGGFTDLRVTAFLSNVQCEVCHGPGQEHVKEMRAAEALQREGKPVPTMQAEMKMDWNQQFCMQCHDPQNDPQFNFNEDILRVRHKDPSPPRIRPATVSLD